MNAIEIKNLTKRYGSVTAVDRLTLSIAEGEHFALLGVNGAGKTTTVKMLSTLTSPTDGDAYLMGHSIRTERSAVKRCIGVSPQETAVAPNLSVQENLTLLCEIHGLRGEALKRRMQDLVERFGLQSVLQRKAGKLSGGWQRRLSIALALVSEPAILFLDEPTLGLDVIARAELHSSIQALKGSTTLILTTHYMEEAEKLCDRIGIMKDGRLLAVGSARQLKEQTGKDRFEDAFIDIIKGGIS